MGSLRCRLCWKVTLAVFASILVIEAVILVPSYINYERNRLRAIATAGRQAVEAAIGGNDPTSDASSIQASLRNTAIRGFRLERNGSTVIAGGESLPSEPDLGGSLRTRRQRGSGDRTLTAWSPPTLEPGYRIVASLDTSNVGSELRAFLLRMAGLILLIATFVTAVAMAVFQRLVLGPLLHLHARIRAEDTPERGSTRRSGIVAGQDELQQTRSALEAMLERHKSTLRLIADREAQYRQLSQDLDARVEARTRELEAANASLEHRANYDALTNLPNRDLFLTRLERALAGETRASPCVAVMLVGLEEFASIAGVHGYNAGDTLLRSLAQRLSAIVPEGGTAAHLRGDVFALIAPCSSDSEHREELARLGKRIADAIEAPVELPDRHVECMARVGTSRINQGGQSAEGLMREADIALVQAKRSEVAPIQVFDDWMNDELAARMDLIAGLRRALQNHEFHLVYQPKCDATGRPQSVEALVRWCTPEGHEVSPGDFVPLAESTGLITDLGWQVLDQAVAQAAAWYHRHEPKAVAVNLSVLQMRHADISNQVQRLLEHYRLPAELLAIEITESALMSDVGQAVSVLEGLSSLGVRLAIDDFGTGYSSLAYLARLPIDELKIDKQFVDDIPQEPQSMAVCRAIIEMGRALDKTIVAEGVETPNQRDWLLAQGCTVMQGFFFYRPALPDQLAPPVTAAAP